MQDLLAQSERFRSGLLSLPRGYDSLEVALVSLWKELPGRVRRQHLDVCGVAWVRGRRDKNAQAQILMKDDTQLLNFKG